MSIARPASIPQPRRSRFHPDFVDLLGVLAFGLMIVSVGLALLYAPRELIQGEPQRIFYFHLPMAINSYVAFLIVFIGSIGYLWTRDMKYDVLARSTAELGVFFTTLVIITGGLWGQSTWGTFWQWEPRLTFTFVLWLIFVAYIMLRQAAQDKERIARFSSVLGIIGFVDVPLIFASVYLWRSLHPEPAGMPRDMAITLVVSIFAFAALFAYLLIHRVRWDRTKDKIEEMRSSLEE